MARTNAQPNANKALLHKTARVEDLFEVFIVDDYYPIARAPATQAHAAQLHRPGRISRLTVVRCGMGILPMSGDFSEPRAGSPLLSAFRRRPRPSRWFRGFPRLPRSAHFFRPSMSRITLQCARRTQLEEPLCISGRCNVLRYQAAAPAAPFVT
jgi:hypothetical protein